MTAPIRLVATDLDGTLLGAGGVVSPRTVEAIEAVVAAGIQVVAATGRSQWTAEPLLEPVNGVALVVCSNGASLYDLRQRASLAEHPIADAVIDEILVRLGRGLPGCFYGWETAADLHYEQRFITYRPALDRPASPDLPVGERPVPIRKLMIAHDEVHHVELLEALLPLMPDACLATTSGASFVEVTGDGVDKAFGVQQVCAAAGIGAHEVLAFGDHHNDVSMLRWAGRGIAMGNAHEVVRTAVEETTLGHLDDGVAVVLEALL